MILPEPWELFPLPPDQRAKIQQYIDARIAEPEREVSELRDIIAALMIKYAPYAGTSDARRAVLNPDVTGAVESSLLLIDTSNPGMVVIRYGAA